MKGETLFLRLFLNTISVLKMSLGSKNNKTDLHTDLFYLTLWLYDFSVT